MKKLSATTPASRQLTLSTQTLRQLDCAGGRRSPDDLINGTCRSLDITRCFTRGCRSLAAR